MVGAVGTRGYGQGDPRKQDLRWPGVRVMQGGTSFPAQAGVLCTLVEIKLYEYQVSVLKYGRIWADMGKYRLALSVFI